MIDWDNKILELDGKTIDCVWNGMTLTDEVKSSMECSNAYLNNAQIVIVPSDKADQYQTEDSIKELSFAVEAGSAVKHRQRSLVLLIPRLLPRQMLLWKWQQEPPMRQSSTL